MTAADDWLAAYRDDPADAGNKALHWVCVPLLVIGVVGLLWSLPVPASLSQSIEALNWGTLFLMAAVVYYFILSISLAFGILPFIVFVVLIVFWLDGFETPLWLISSDVLVLAWTGQFIAYRLEGKRPQFFKDLHYLMLGPLWLLAAIYRRLNIPY